MPYIPVPDDVTQPAATVLAGTAAEEFRNLKTKINNFFRQDGYHAPLLQQNCQAGTMTMLNLPAGTDPGILYGHAVNITRNDLAAGGVPGGVQVVAGQFTAAMGASLNGLARNASVFGIATEAWTDWQGASHATLIGGEVSVISQYNANTMPLIGLDVVYKNRPDGFAAVRQGLGANQYNTYSRAIEISSQPRSTATEFCGWHRGIIFEGGCLDNMKDPTSGGPVGAVGIDFTPLGVAASTEPWTAYRMIAAISLSEYMSITWDFDRQTRTWLDSGNTTMWLFGIGGYPTTQGKVGWNYSGDFMDYPNIGTSSSAPAGAAGALPATVSGYKHEKLNGVMVRIPYYVA